MNGMHCFLFPLEMVTLENFPCRGYIAPEFINSGVITIKSDIYSLGIIIIEILTGQKGYLRTESVRMSYLAKINVLC